MRSVLYIVALLCLLAGIACSDDDNGGQPPRVDGTVVPGNPGSTNPVSVTPRPNPPRDVAVLEDVRTGAHPEDGGWDRIVFEFAADLPAATVTYMPEVIGCGSGLPIAVDGSAFLQVRFDPAQAHDDAGRLTVASTRIAGPGNAIVEARVSCDFEAELTWAIGTNRMANYKVTTLTNPTRLVVDVRWGGE
jgi:hypothetical protein